jgi:N utilization substance protein A
MKSEFLTAFNQICAERKLPREVVLEAVKTALVSAYRRNTGAPAGQNVTVEIDPETGAARIYVELEVAAQVADPQLEISLEHAQSLKQDAELGDQVMVENTPRDFGRIAAQTARQVILQRIREAEREAQFAHYVEQEGELVYGTVQSASPQYVTLYLGRTEAVMPRKEQVPGERYATHDRIRAYVLEVRRTTRGPHIVVSRAHKRMLRRLLELEVPEVASGAVEIKSISREAGSRSKVAVSARQPGVDPVGACVGMRGMRIQSIVKELGGEKVDIIEWNADSVTYIAKSLSPARVLSVQLDENPAEGRTANVVVPDDQLSLAIGRAGQNARLAAKLTGWRIDIQGVTEALEWALKQINDDSDVLPSLGAVAERLPVVAGALRRYTVENLPYNVEELVAVRQVIEGVRGYYISMRDAERARLAAQESARKAALEEARTARQAAIDEARALIPSGAFDVDIAGIGISKRVLGHLERAGLENVGQLMEHLAEGNEGLLKLDGIGPKALAEVQESLQQFVPPPVVEEVAEEVTAAVEPEVELVAEEATVLLEEAEPAVSEEAVLVEEEAVLTAEQIAVEEPLAEEAAVPEEATPAPGEEPAAVDVSEEAGEELGEQSLDWEAVLEDEPLEDESEQDLLEPGKKKRRKRRKRKLVYDEDLGETVAVRRPGEWEDEDWGGA